MDCTVISIYNVVYIKVFSYIIGTDRFFAVFKAWAKSLITSLISS